MKAWYETFDWIGTGYILFIIGSTLYFIQALDPYLDPYIETSADDNKLFGYYSDGPLDDLGISAWLSLVAGIIFVIESMFYIISWYIGRNCGDMNIKLNEWYFDWNHWGNIFFLVGSLGYIFTSVVYMSGRRIYHQQADAVNLAMGVLFVFDSIFYFLAIVQSEYSRCRSSYVQPCKCTFDSLIDIYLIATLVFIVGSVVYLIEAVQAHYQEEDAVSSNLVAASIFLLDAPLYLVSLYQYRSDNEIAFLERKNFFLLEFNDNDTDSIALFDVYDSAYHDDGSSLLIGIGTKENRVLSGMHEC
jgi:hypothetical protein